MERIVTCEVKRRLKKLFGEFLDLTLSFHEHFYGAQSDKQIFKKK